MNCEADGHTVHSKSFLHRKGAGAEHFAGEHLYRPLKGPDQQMGHFKVPLRWQCSEAPSKTPSISNALHCTGRISPK